MTPALGLLSNNLIILRNTILHHTVFLYLTSLAVVSICVPLFLPSHFYSNCICVDDMSESNKLMAQIWNKGLFSFFFFLFLLLLHLPLLSPPPTPPLLLLHVAVVLAGSTL